MPIKYIDRFIESATLSSDLELQAQSAEGFVIKEIYAESAVEGEFITMIISDTVMFSVLTDLAKIGMTRFSDAKEVIRGLFEKIRLKYPNIPLFRVSEGEKLVIKRLTDNTRCLIRYAHLTGAEIPKSTEGGGTLSDNRLLISNGIETFVVSSDLTDYLTTFISMNPSGIIDFPFGVKVPAGYRLELLGFCLDIGTVVGTGTIIDGIRLWFRDESILAPLQAYLSNDLFHYISTEGQLIPFLFDTPIEMVAGDELKTEIQITGTIADAGSVYISFIFNQIKI
ncbi:hypothetical protein LCGC14_0876520 [marine sediment metagenome]|uniref:Uncharacterized protein n=1 Tax=marine sediment metagenome TaxID=412755 RepID=A0A0F9P339_9ZZZZ|nr:hypothetical protein [bacterium]